MLHQIRKPHIIILRLAAVLLIMVMLSTSMVAGRYARYVSTASGSDTARVAVFNVEEGGSLMNSFSEGLHDLYPGQTIKKEIVVNNKSEVTIEYTVSAKSTYEFLPLEYTVSVGGNAENAENAENVKLPVPYRGTMAPGDEATITLNIEWPADKNNVSYCGKVDMVEVTLNATQVD